ncbi:MAG TPA: DUF5615 family PIN-like protein [Solirubrobacteraceae bacterium]|nr:DUF5615 family PIN-like protein [Solirubrobacteraceae bacterium]
MKLLLDEHMSPEIARRLRERGHDVVAVSERPDLRGRPDRVHFAGLPDEQRAIVTRDLADFRPLLAEKLRHGERTYGLVCVSRRFPLNRDGIGRLVLALDGLLQAHPQIDDAIASGGELWLEEPAKA